MADEQVDPVAAALKMAPATDAVRADVWDAYHSAASADDFAAKVKDIKIPDSVKADLWDLKQKSSVVQVPMNQARVNGKDVPVSWDEPGGDVILDNLRSIRDVGVGAVKGAANTAVGLGRLVHLIPGVDEALGKLPKDASSTLGLEPTNTAQKIGDYGEQTAEFLYPATVAEHVATSIAAKAAPYFANTPRFVQSAAKLAPKVVTQAAAGGATTAAQGGDATTGAMISGAAPVIGAGANAAAQWIGSKAEPLVRAAVKPTVAAMRQVAGASVQGIEAQATKLVRFIIDSGATTAEKARTIITQAEQELQRVLTLKNAPTDAPQRAIRYLSALEKSAAKQGLPAADVATIRNAAAEVFESGLGHDVITMTPTPHPTLVGSNGQPLTVLTPQTTRALRTDVTASEAMDRARANSQWDTRNAWGAQSRAPMEASKAIERAERDAAKVAVPELRPILARQGQAIQAAKALDRMEFRQGNRDAVSLPAHVMAAGELAAGKVPVLAFAANWLRNNQMRAGIWADRLSKAIESQNTQEVASILSRFGVGATAQLGRPSPARP